MQERTTPALSAVIRIDVDVVLGQVARPEGRDPLPFPAMRKTIETSVSSRRSFISASSNGAARPLRQTFTSCRVISTGDGIEVHAGIARGRKNAAPVGIGTGDGGLYQRRIGDRPGDGCGRGVAERAVHFDGNQFARAFAVAHDLASERLQGFGSDSSKRLISFGSGRTPEAPLASTMSVSFVEVSPSTEMRL